MAEANYADFLARTGAGEAGKPDYAAFLARTGAVAATEPEAKSASSDYDFAGGDYPGAEASTFGQTARAPAPPGVISLPRPPPPQQRFNDDINQNDLDAIGRVGEAIRQTWRDTPNMLMTPRFQAQLENGGPLDRFVTQPILTAGGNALAALGAGFRGVQQAATELGGGDAGPGRDVAAFMEAAPMLGRGPRIAGAAAPNALAAGAVEAAPPAGWRLLTADEPRAPGMAIATDKATGRQYVQTAPSALDPNATPGPPAPEVSQPGSTTGAPVPQSVGAAASRDMATEPPPAKTRAEQIRDLESSVNQTAEDRAGPQLEDHTAYVAGIPPRLTAAREFTPTNALDEKVAIAQDPQFRAAVEANKRDRNIGMVDLLRNDAKDEIAVDVAHQARSEVSPVALGVFDGEKPVDASGLTLAIQKLLAGPEGKQGAVRNTLNNVLQSLHDGEGNLESAPSMVYGARKNLTDLLKKGVKGTGDMADDVRASKQILSSLLPAFDETISSGAPKFSSEYLPQYAEMSRPIDQMEFLQRYQTGAKKITDGDGYLQPMKVQKMLDDVLQGQKAPGVNPAKSLTDEQIQNIVNVRNELFADKLKDRMAAVRGSDSFQQINRAITPTDSPTKAAVKGAASLGTHAAIAASPAAGWGNAALYGYKGIIKPAIDAAKARDAAAAIAARKQKLLETRNPLPPPD